MSSGYNPNSRIEPIKGHHNVSKLIYHLVLVNKYRKANLDEHMVEMVLREVISSLGLPLIEISVGEQNHAHILLQASPKEAMSIIVAKIKAKSSSILKPIPEWQGWSSGFYLATVGTNDLSAVEKYIRNQ